MNIYQIIIVLYTTIRFGANMWRYSHPTEEEKKDKKEWESVLSFFICVGLYILMMWLYYKAGIFNVQS